MSKQQEKNDTPYLQQILLTNKISQRKKIPLVGKGLKFDSRLAKSPQNRQFIYQNKLQNRQKYKKIFETLTKPKNKNSFIFAQLHKKSHNIKSQTLITSENMKNSRMNQLILRAQMNNYITKQSISKSFNIQQGKNLNEGKFSFFHKLRRSFRISDYCKHSLLQLNHRNQTKKWQSICTSFSYISGNVINKKSHKRQGSQRIVKKPKYSCNQNNYSKQNQISSWQLSPTRFLTDYQTNDLSF